MREPTEYEKRALVAAAIALGVQACFDLHTYQFGGSTYHQQGGSPIGVDLSGDVAELEVVDWTIMLMEVLTDNKIVTDEDFIYDVREILPPINRGWQYNTKNKKFQYDKDLHQVMSIINIVKIIVTTKENSSRTLLLMMKYIAVMMPEKEIEKAGMNKFVPRRYTNRGPKPTVRYLESDVIIVSNGDNPIEDMNNEIEVEDNDEENTNDSLKTSETAKKNIRC